MLHSLLFLFLGNLLRLPLLLMHFSLGFLLSLFSCMLGSLCGRLSLHGSFSRLCFLLSISLLLNGCLVLPQSSDGLQVFWRIWRQVSPLIQHLGLIIQLLHSLNHPVGVVQLNLVHLGIQKQKVEFLHELVLDKSQVVESLLKSLVHGYLNQTLLLLHQLHMRVELVEIVRFQTWLL